MSQRTIAIVTSSSSMPGASALRAAFAGSGWRAASIVVGDGKDCGPAIDSADEVIFRINQQLFTTYSHTVLPALRNPKHAALLRRVIDGFDKGVQAEFLRTAGVPVPETRIARELPELADWVPCVLKYPVGNQGTGVFLAETPHELKTRAAEIIARAGTCVQQEYIPVVPVSDKRLFVVGSQVVASMRRMASGSDFRSNLHQGGSAEAYQPTDQEEALAVRAAQYLQLPFCGVDVIDSDRGPLVLEVNPSPGFAVAEITGVPVVDKIVEYYNQGENI